LFQDRFFLYQDLNATIQGIPRLYSNLTKNRTETFVAGGTLWADPINKYLYSFAGEGASTKIPVVEGLETYDIIYNKWNRSKIPWHIHRVSWGASTISVERGEGYLLGGWINNRTTPGFSGKQMTDGLVKYDMCNNAFSNFTGPDSNGRSEGSMVFIPASDSGMLVYFGGLLDPTFNGSMIGSPMDTIVLYNIQNGQWYTQKATGDIPPMRRRFCAGVTWPADYSSYNIYVFGGLGVSPDGLGFDDVYILTLPSFQWIKWWTAAPVAARPRHSMTCNVINKGQACNSFQ
jgi:Kelch motif